MAFLVVCIWLASAVLAYFVARVTVLCCDRNQWNHSARIMIAVFCFLLGPIALIVFLEMCILAEGGREIQHHHKPLHKH